MSKSIPATKNKDSIRKLTCCVSGVLGKNMLTLSIIVFLPGRINLPQELLWHLRNQNVVVIAIICF